MKKKRKIARARCSGWRRPVVGHVTLSIDDVLADAIEEMRSPDGKRIHGSIGNRTLQWLFEEAVMALSEYHRANKHRSYVVPHCLDLNFKDHGRHGEMTRHYIAAERLLATMDPVEQTQ